MKKIIKWVITGIVIFIIVSVVNKVFFGGEKVTAFFGKEFTLKVNDQAKIEDEVIVKLLKVNDNRCKDETCEREGEMVAKVMVVNNHHISYAELGTLADKSKKLEKDDYEIELISIDEDYNATFKLYNLAK